ncbi:MAG: hypothetical protein BA863_12320 [Desulfovibrio sp. S3730MH75]|nr:MAG: hypothetical protein BA863_12320 [Desulfovibrio sp. S3730MH75]
MKVPCKIILGGDKVCARDYIGAAQSQLRILEGELKFQGLKQGIRKTELNPKVSVEATINHQFREVRIYCIPISARAEKGGEKPPEMERFFARVRRGGLYEDPEFYWITFKDGRVVARKVGTSDPAEHSFRVVPTLWRMTNLPIHTKHAATKSFMLNKGNDEFPNYERWVSAQHSLVKGCVVYFLPLIYPSILNPMYPMPAVCAGSDDEIGDLHRCPPNRFYANTEAGVMAWYHASDFGIWGIMLRIKEGMMHSVGTFCYYPADGNGHGFTPYWYYQGVEGDDLPNHPEVPVYMVTDLEYLDENTLEVTMPLNSWPFKISKNFSTGVETFSQVSNTTHCYWTEDGFEHKQLASVEQENKSDIDEYKEHIVDNPPGGCSDYDSEVSCEADHGHAREYQGYKKQWVDRGTYRESSYEITVFDRELKTESWSRHFVTDDHKREYLYHCAWSTDHCHGGGITPWTIKRFVEESIKQKLVNSATASWEGTNLARINADISRAYTDASATQSTRAMSNIWGSFTDYADFEDFCRWPFMEGTPDEWQIAYFDEAKCFYSGYPMPGDDWSEVESQGISSTLNGPLWWKATDKDDYVENTVSEFSIDGEIIFDTDMVDRTYYLDDRSSCNAEGLVVAGRAADIDYDPQGFPIFTSTYWKIYHGGEDVTDAVLEALHCEVSELIELGLA